MKTGKLHNYMAGVSLMALLFTLLMLSCGAKTPSPESVARKIDANEKLTQADYASILDYCGEYSKKAQKYFDLINTQPSDSTAEYNRAASEMAALSQEYPYLDMFRGVIYNLPEKALDQSNLDKVKEYTRYQAFPLPNGAGVDMSNPAVVGDIEEMPDSDTGNIIAAGDGEVVNIPVK